MYHTSQAKQTPFQNPKDLFAALSMTDQRRAKVLPTTRYMGEGTTTMLIFFAHAVVDHRHSITGTSGWFGGECNNVCDIAFALFAA